MRWNKEARRLSSLKRLAGRRLENSQKRLQIEKAVRQKREFWEIRKKKEDTRRKADDVEAHLEVKRTMISR